MTVERLLWWVADKAERKAFRMKEARLLSHREDDLILSALCVVLLLALMAAVTTVIWKLS